MGPLYSIGAGPQGDGLVTTDSRKSYLSGANFFAQTRANLWGYILRAMTRYGDATFHKLADFMITTTSSEREGELISKCIKDHHRAQGTLPFGSWNTRVLLKRHADQGNEEVLRALLQVAVHGTSEEDLRGLLSHSTK